jgi:hypothetical protein
LPERNNAFVPLTALARKGGLVWDGHVLGRAMADELGERIEPLRLLLADRRACSKSTTVLIRE